MQKTKNKNYKIIIGFILGLIVSGVVVYAATIESKNVSYDNTKSGISATTLQGVLDELYKKVSFNDNIVLAYTYDESSCKTGIETTCVSNTCYKNKVSNSCTPGTIIKYIVSPGVIKNFYVLHDDGKEMTMQDVNSTGRSNFGNANTASDGTEIFAEFLSLRKMQEITSSWSNVESQTLILGDYMSYCRGASVCTEKLTTKARMITTDEANHLGCSASTTCPTFLQATSTYHALNIGFSYHGATALYLLGGEKVDATRTGDRETDIRAVISISK